MRPLSNTLTMQIDRHLHNTCAQVDSQQYHYLGNCVHAFDSDTGLTELYGLPYSDVNHFACREENYQEVEKGIKISEKTASFFREGAEVLVLKDPLSPELLVLYDTDADIHYFFSL